MVSSYLVVGCIACLFNVNEVQHKSEAANLGRLYFVSVVAGCFPHYIFPGGMTSQIIAGADKGAASDLKAMDRCLQYPSVSPHAWIALAVRLAGSDRARGGIKDIADKNTMVAKLKLLLTSFGTGPGSCRVNACENVRRVGVANCGQHPVTVFY